MYCGAELSSSADVRVARLVGERVWKGGGAASRRSSRQSLCGVRAVLSVLAECACPSVYCARVACVCAPVFTG